MEGSPCFRLSNCYLGSIRLIVGGCFSTSYEDFSMRTLMLAAVLMTASVAAQADVSMWQLCLDVAVGYNATRDEGGFAGPKDTARFTLTWMPKDDGVFVSYTHVSHFSVGWPVNKKPEDYVDMLEVGYRFNFNKLF